MIEVRKCKPPMRAFHHAYTMAEVAATLVILLVLAVSLVPTTAGVRRSSKEATCLNNLARISYANLVYSTQDLDNMALPVHHGQFNQDESAPTFIGAYEWGGKSGRGFPHWVPGPSGNRAFLTSKYGTKAGVGPATRPLNELIYNREFEDHNDPRFDEIGAAQDTLLDLEVYHCPSDVGYTGIHFVGFRAEGYSSYDHFGTSYTANIFRISLIGGGPIWSNSPYLHRMSRLLSPSTTLAFQENNGRYAWAAGSESCDFIQPIAGTVRGWHGKDWSFNAAFMDGHVDTIHMRGFRGARVLQDDQDQANLRCIILRGECWQIDTLPLKPVPTGLRWSGWGDRPTFEGGIQ